MIEGVSHLTLVVKDLERTSRLFRSSFDAEEVYSSGDKAFSLAIERFFLVGGQWIALMQGDSQSARTYDHVAFKISDEEFDAYKSRIQAAGVELGPQRARVTGEGRSLYFYDFDNHLFELHTGTLVERLARYARQ